MSPATAALLIRPSALPPLKLGRMWKPSDWLPESSVVILMLVGALSLLWRKTTLHPGHTPQRLVTGGIYRYTRNPIYLGMLFILFTIPLMAMQPRLLIFTLIYFVVMDFYVIPREEKIIRNGFGTDYAVYQRRTRRWLGTYY